MGQLNEGMFSSDDDGWRTPPDLFRALDQEFHFELDAAATWANALCRRYWTKKDDALTKPWDGPTYCNPPYGREIAGFVKKAVEEAARGEMVVMLLPARTDTRWWHDYVMQAAEIRLIKGRLQFLGAPSSAPFPSVVAVFSPEAGVAPRMRVMAKDDEGDWVTYSGASKG